MCRICSKNKYFTNFVQSESDKTYHIKIVFNYYGVEQVQHPSAMGRTILGYWKQGFCRATWVFYPIKNPILN